MRWSRAGIFNKIFPELSRQHGASDCLMIDATPLKAPERRPACSKRGAPPLYWPHERWSEFEAARRCDGPGKPVRLWLTAGQTSDDTGARHRLPRLPRTHHLIADRGCDADWWVAALKKNGITPCIPPRHNRKTQRRYSKPLYTQRHKIEIMFGRIKDWRRSAMRYDRCAHTFFSAICLAATVIVYLNE